MFTGSKHISATFGFLHVVAPLVASGVVKCSQRISGAIMEIGGGWDCPFLPANCPARTETGLDYAYSTAANRAFEGEAQAGPT